jgi:hypothetical protein
MIYVPSYQVLEFLDWLCNYGMILPNHQLDNDEKEYLESLATKFLAEKLDVENSGKSPSLPRFLLWVFQSCDEIGESTIEEQMGHFAKCGRCFHMCDPLRNLSRQREFTSSGQSFPGLLGVFGECPLHSLLQGFLDWSIENNNELFLETDWDFNPDHDHHDWEFWFCRVIRERGGKLQKQFGKYIEYVKEHNPSSIEDYLQWRKEKGANRARSYKIGFRQFDKETKPIDSNSNTEEAAKRLVDSVVRAWSQEYRDFFAEEMLGGVKELRMEMVVQEQLLPQSLEFLQCLKIKMPDLNLPGSIPKEQFKELALNFCDDKGYTNGNDFAEAATRWLYGRGSQSFLKKIIDFLTMKGLKRSIKNPHHDIGNPFDRYNSIRFHGLFLFANSNGYNRFIKNNWVELNSMTGDLLDLHYSYDDLKGVDGYRISRMFKSFKPTANQIPSLVLWENLSNPIFISLERLMDADIIEVLKHVVTHFQEVNGNVNVSDSGASSDLAAAANIGNNKAQELRQMNRTGSTVNINTFSGVGNATVNTDSFKNIESSTVVGRDMKDNTVMQNVGNISPVATLNAQDIELVKKLIDGCQKKIDGVDETDRYMCLSLLEQIKKIGPNADSTSAVDAWCKWLKGLSKSTLNALWKAFPTYANVVTTVNDNVLFKTLREAVEAIT